MSEPTLKLVVAWSNRRNLCSTVVDTLRETVPEDDLRRAGDDAVVVHTADTAEAIRDRLSVAIRDDEAILVVEFEKWSGYGKGIDAKWLLARGH